MDYQKILEDIYLEILPYAGKGAQADYIPALAKVDPVFIFALIQSHFFKDFSNFWCIKLIGILAGLILIPVLFYTINGIFGKTPDFINIAIFFIVAATVFIIETYLFKNYHCCKSPYISFFFFCFIGLLFIIFTFLPPHIPLFEDPVTNTYGYQQ